MKERKFRILWKRKGEDKACGWGEPIFASRADAEEWAKKLNKNIRRCSIG